VVGAGLSVESIQQAATQAVAKPTEPNRVACTGCGVQLRASSALRSENRPYCVKCAPPGATLVPRSAASSLVPVAKVGPAPAGQGFLAKLGSLFG